LIREIWRRDGPLAATGTLMFLVLAAVLFVAALDHRTVLGLNAWVKPVKFLISVGIFVWTLAWFMPCVTGPRGLKRLVSVGVSIAMVIEIALIITQAARGVPSHFNVDTAFDARVFGVLTAFLGVNTLLLGLFAWMLLTHASREVSRPYLLAVRLGTLLLLAGSLEGAVMIQHGAHAVGVADGGPGFRYLNWSTEGGDLRAAHAFALHGFQLIPLFAFLMGRRTPDVDAGRQSRRVAIFATFYAILVVGLFWQAMMGRPLL